MSTNFYFKIKMDVKLETNVAKEIKKNIEDKVKELIEELSEIHIGKRYSFWNSLFQKTDYYSSVKEIKEFYEKNKENLIVVDEYNREYAFEDLEEELFTWNRENSKSHLENDSNCYYLDEEGYEFLRNEFS